MSCHLGVVEVRSAEKRKAHLKVGLLAPLAVLTQLKAVVAQEHHNSSFSKTKVSQSIKHPVRALQKYTEENDESLYRPISLSAWDTEA